MHPTGITSKAKLFILFGILPFGAGLVLVLATQMSTEGRSKASGIEPYITPLSCSGERINMNGDCRTKLEYMTLRAKDPRCNGTSPNNPCPYPPVTLSANDQSSYLSTLPKCTPAIKFSNILCKD